MLNAYDGFGNWRIFADTPICQSACASVSTANDVRSSVNALAPRTRRNATRSVPTDASTAAAIITGIAPHQPTPRVERK